MVIYPDKQRTDGVAYALCQRIKTDLPILLLSRVEELDLNEQVFELAGKPFIVIDYIENGWDCDFKETLVVGRNTQRFPFLKFDKGWDRVDEFLYKNPPVFYFKRELLDKDESKWLKPIEYPNWQEEFQLSTKYNFKNRPVTAFNYWGRSHEARLMLHGEIWKNAARKGYTVCDNIYQFNDFMHDERSNPNKWISFHMPHYARVDISELMKINACSKFSISLPGCGIKCFRSTGESLVNSIVVLPEDKLAYSYPLEHGGNCIRFPIESVDGISKEWKVCEAIEEAMQRSDLYEIYLEGYKAAEFYRIDNYINHLESIINNV